MESNFYIGTVHHQKRLFKQQYQEKIVLYSTDNINFIDLINCAIYSTDVLNKDYVIRESLVPTEISEYRTDYMYLLSVYKPKIMTRYRKKKQYIKKTSI